MKAEENYDRQAHYLEQYQHSFLGTKGAYKESIELYLEERHMEKRNVTVVQLLIVSPNKS